MAMTHHKNSRGFALLVAVIFMSVMLSLGLTLASLGYKQVLLASSSTESHYAFYAADAALECALYADQKQNLFAAPRGGSPLSCNGTTFTVATSTGGGRLISRISNVSIGTGATARCANITVYKPLGSGSSYLFAEGYNVPCAQVSSNPRVSARGIFATY